jgi:RND family efflux transporter MFP subunit
MHARPLVLVAVFGLSVAALTAAGCHRAGPAKPGDTGPLVVTVSHPLVDKVTLFTSLTGTVDAKETVELRPRVSGYITEVKFKEGDEVEKDQPLFQIDQVIYKSQLKQAEGQVQNYQAQLQKADADLSRAKEAFDKGALARSELDIAVANKGIAEAQLFTARASVEQAQQNLTWTTVLAPIAGRVDRAYQTPGNLVTGTTTTTGGTGTVLTTIVSVNPMYAYFDADEQSVLYYRRMFREGKLKSVQTGAVVEASLQLRGETGFPHKGALDFVSNRLNPATGSLTIRGVFPNPDRFLMPGLFCRAQIPATQPFDALLIPPVAVVSDQGQRAIFVVGSENRVESRLVDLGPLHRGLQVIGEGVTKDATGRARGLARSDRVVIRGMQRVAAGMVVDPQDGAITYPPEPPAAPGPAAVGGGDRPKAPGKEDGSPVDGGGGAKK